MKKIAKMALVAVLVLVAGFLAGCNSEEKEIKKYASEQAERVIRSRFVEQSGIYSTFSLKRTLYASYKKKEESSGEVYHLKGCLEIEGIATDKMGDPAVTGTNVRLWVIFKTTARKNNYGELKINEDNIEFNTTTSRDMMGWEGFKI